MAHITRPHYFTKRGGYGPYNRLYPTTMCCIEVSMSSQKSERSVLFIEVHAQKKGGGVLMPMYLNYVIISVLIGEKPESAGTS